ncbi:hypothetical protein UO65_2565 [Actinokineospora spheciospongiae]|uniref:Uncharacterized protein n=1 Tax=Actinokineospora spheciospongiae TaxID=909613 RepID=W7J855_9PSEU|nr:hypothetical protein UO65_2565 [Actinokineospora spheciospongiae]
MRHPPPPRSTRTCAKPRACLVFGQRKRRESTGRPNPERVRPRGRRSRYRRPRGRTPRGRPGHEQVPPRAGTPRGVPVQRRWSTRARVVSALSR